ncbi:GAF domain-containing protein [Trypanosoma theileri]|uniref:GAF domain-containing protein n=1 Tax=Trypanosoma theileri TaxID=67003 RepID=A0A1X0NWX3_9TRYP|nr:GAF domain-containing protein [Trypanosoma theileri]ORC89111.1 GAF domain-containing protein [Trypanosoma theileri]
MCDEDRSASTKSGVTKKELYDRLGIQVKAFVEDNNRKIVPNLNMGIQLGNIAALLFYELNAYVNPSALLQDTPINWLGFYLLQSPELLVLGPFQGRPACSSIQVGRGVCGSAVEKGETLIIPDVHKFPGHIACDSASNSEIVIPIKTSKGQVVGVIDVDSTQLDFFDEVDANGLEQIATIISEEVDFPLSRVLVKNPLVPSKTMVTGTPEVHHNMVTEVLPLSSSSNIKAVVIKPTVTPPATLPSKSFTTILGTVASEKPVTSMEPEVKSMEIGGWKFTATELTRILTQDEVSLLEKKVGISAIPEIQFAFNSLQIAPVMCPDKPLVTFSLEDVLRSAAAFYHTDAYRSLIAPQLTIPVAESWKNSPYATFDPGVDWAWRNNYFGIDDHRCSLRLLEPDMPGVNWDLLRNQTVPILFFHQFDMMEDDLHDHGVVKSSLRVRAMPTAFFILFRHFIRVDGHRVWMRDVRLFHEYTVRRADGQPHIVVCEEIRTLDTGNNEQWRDCTPDEYARDAKVLQTNNYYVSIDDPTDRDWWSSIHS